MNSRDLGDLDGPLLVFGGPYSNLAATRAMRTEAERLAVPPGRCICTGDVVAYCADPEVTVQEIRDWGIHVVMGNCEESLAASAPDCGCGFEEGSTCHALAGTWYPYAAERVSEDSRRWMGELPRAISLRLAGWSFRAVHGGVGEINRFIYPSTPATLKATELDDSGADGILAGHSGLPFVQKLGERLWINAGVIGLPANDGSRDGWYALLTPTAEGLEIALRRLPYDADASARAMLDAGLPEGYAAALLSGLWPSLDAMPETEQAWTGQRLPAEIRATARRGSNPASVRRSD